MRSLTAALKSCRPETFRCIPPLTQINQMIELPLQHTIKFGKGRTTSLLFDSDVLEEGCI